MSAETWPQRLNLSCPFCGSKGMYRGRFGHGVWVQCTNCGARLLHISMKSEANEEA